MNESAREFLDGKPSEAMPSLLLQAKGKTPTKEVLEAETSIQNVTRSALFDRLDSFLPQLQKENAKLHQDVTEGRGEKYNIEVEEKDAEKQVVEMNFALGLMNGFDDANCSTDQDSEDDECSTDDDDDPNEPKLNLVIPGKHRNLSTGKPIIEEL